MVSQPRVRMGEWSKSVSQDLFTLQMNDKSSLGSYKSKEELGHSGKVPKTAFQLHPSPRVTKPLPTAAGKSPVTTALLLSDNVLFPSARKLCGRKKIIIPSLQC